MNTEAPETLFGGPTKRFFVSMLTRDIELSGAILDLIDNCIDGAMRKNDGQPTGSRPFEGYKAELVLNADQFTLSDNCGGIPAGYIEEAFQLGRPNMTKDGNLPTVGMYGIGMKRAIFKMGTDATVSSNAPDGFFEVNYSSEWLDPNNSDWDLPINRSNRLEGVEGVTIEIPSLKPDIKRQFSNVSFINSLMLDIQDNFGYLMQKGFEISVNGTKLLPKTLGLHFAAPSEDKAIRPYDYSGIHDGVEVRVAVGFFRRLAAETEIDRETQTPTDTETAGISVICNDRVILLNDRTIKTGWGDAGVPRYHPQFRSIAGLIEFRSNDADKLPISTTKRGLDAGSDVYFAARKAVTEGLKIFTSFTNKFKGIEVEADQFFDRATRSDVKTSVTLALDHGVISRDKQTKKYVPALPVPTNKTVRRRISYVRPEDEIQAVSKFLLGDPDQEPAVVGAECFEHFLKKVK